MSKHGEFVRERNGQDNEQSQMRGKIEKFLKTILKKTINAQNMRFSRLE